MEIRLALRRDGREQLVVGGSRIGNPEVRDASGNWQPLDPAASYRLITNNFTADGGDKYDTLKAIPEAQREDTFLDYADSFLQYVRSRTPLPQPVALAVLYLDIDFLKPINDRYGHAAGDLVIRTFAERVVACVRDADLVARIGGDEFVVLSEHVDAGAANEAAEHTARAVIAVMTEPVMFGEIALRTGSSIGIAVTQSVQQADTLIAEADRALYAAKAAGRNTWRRAEAH